MTIEIPEPIREQCEKKGGIKGLKKILPGKRYLEKRSQVFQALSDPLRLKIMLALVEQPLCVCMVKDIVNPKISDSKLSYHINILKDTGLIRGERKASWIIYEPTRLGKEAVKVTGKL